MALLSLLQTDDVFLEAPTHGSQKNKKCSETVKTFSLYLGARFYFDLNLISAFYKFLVIIIIFFSLYL